MFVGIRLKLSFITLLLLALVTAVSSVIVMRIMDGFLLSELVKRGFSISRSAANSAGYSILSKDRLALDNIVAKTKQNQDDIQYVAVVNRQGIVIAHSDLKKNRSPFVAQSGDLEGSSTDGSRAIRIRNGTSDIYEFRTPIIFAGREIASFNLGINGAILHEAQSKARRQVLLASFVILVLGVIGVYYIAITFTRPIEGLSEGVSRLKSGKYNGIIRVNVRDELGELTRNFNDMAQVIIGQRQKLEEYAHGLEESYLATVKILATSIDARDDYTLQHSTRVASIATSIGHRMGLSVEELKDLEVAALVHDLGKIRVPDHILKKTSPLSDEEYRLIQRHPQDGAAILVHSQTLHKFIPAVLYHHEWFDGTGYPEGRRGKDIPLFASIISIADAYDAMTTSRPYRTGLPEAIAMEEILRYRGSQFDPQLTDLFVASCGDWSENRSFLALGMRL